MIDVASYHLIYRYIYKLRIYTSVRWLFLRPLCLYENIWKINDRVPTADAEISLFSCLDKFCDILTLFLRLCATKYNILLPFFHSISTSATLADYLR